MHYRRTCIWRTQWDQENCGQSYARSVIYIWLILDMHRTETKHIVRHRHRCVVQWSVISKFTCISLSHWCSLQQRGDTDTARSSENHGAVVPHSIIPLSPWGDPDDNPTQTAPAVSAGTIPGDNQHSIVSWNNLYMTVEYQVLVTQSLAFNEANCWWFVASHFCNYFSSTGLFSKWPLTRKRKQGNSVQCWL